MKYLFTKEQTLKAFEAWQCKEPLPTKKTKVIIAFPNRTMATIIKSSAKSTYGKALWEAEIQ